MYSQYGDSFGNDIWLKKDFGQCVLWIGFCLGHVLEVKLECKTKKDAEELLELLEGSRCIEGDERLVRLLPLVHFKAEETIEELSKKINEIVEVIPR